MKDERSIKAVDAAIAFGNGDISREELDATAAYAAGGERTKNQKLTADICRKFLPIEVWNIDINLQYDIILPQG